jgi:hypothetical protein
MKHTLREILAIWAAHVGHTFEAAVQAVYDAGHARAHEEFEAGLASPEPASTASAGETSDGTENKSEESAPVSPDAGQPGQEPQEPAAEDPTHPAA